MYQIIRKNFLSFFYPTACLQCGEKNFENPLLLCKACMQDFHFLDQKQRCHICFTQFEKKGCIECKRDPLPIKATYAAFEQFGPAETLLWEFQRRKELEKTVAALLTIATQHLNWNIQQITANKEDFPTAKVFGKWMQIPVKRSQNYQKILILKSAINDREELRELGERYHGEIHVLSFTIGY